MGDWEDGETHRGFMSKEHDYMFRKMLEEHSDLVEYVIKRAKKASNKVITKIYDDFTDQFNDRTGVMMTPRQVKKKVEYLKFRARKEGFLLAGVAITGGNEPNKTYTTTSKGSSSRPKRKVATSSYANTKSSNGPSSNSLSYLLRDLKEEQIALTRLSSEAAEIVLQSEKIRFEREQLKRETEKMKHAITKEDYNSRFGNEPSNIEEGPTSPRDVKVPMNTDDITANHEEQGGGVVKEKEDPNDVKESLAL